MIPFYLCPLSYLQDTVEGEPYSYPTSYLHRVYWLETRDPSRWCGHTAQTGSEWQPWYSPFIKLVFRLQAAV